MNDPQDLSVLSDPAFWSDSWRDLERSLAPSSPEVQEVPSDSPLSARKRALALVVVRESVVWDLLLIDGMRLQTLAFCESALPGVSFVRDLGLLPLTNPSALEGEVEVEELREGGTVAALFEHEGVLYLYSMGSAALVDERGDNRFTQLLIRVVCEYRPHSVYVATFSRLVRSQEQAGLLLHALGPNVDFVHAGALPIPFSGENAESGKQMFSMFASAAASERTAIVQRLTVGLVHKYNRGEWVRGRQSLPPAGYVLGADKKLRVQYRRTEGSAASVVEPAVADRVRETLTILAGEENARRKVKDLGRLGITSSVIQRHYKDGSISDVTNAESAVRSLLRWAPLYATGRWTASVRNPFPGVTHFAGLKVEAASDDSPGRLHFTYDVGLPPEGWVSTDVLRALHARYQEARQARAPRLRAPAQPFTGLEWSDGASQWRMFTGHKSTYVLRSRALRT